MATKMEDKLSVREGLIRIVNAERFRRKPAGGANVHVVVMERSGGSLRYYCTLRPDSDPLSVGERLWGNYVCYAVDMGLRELNLKQTFATNDRITNVDVSIDIGYRAVNAELVAIGVEDALKSLQDDLTTVLRRDIARIPLNQVTEEQLEARLYQENARSQKRLGLVIENARVRVDWPEEILDQRRAARKAALERRAQDAQRDRDRQIEDQDRRRQEKIELEDIAHIDTLLQHLHMEGLPADLHLRLVALPRQEAYKQIADLIEKYRIHARDMSEKRIEEDYLLLRKLIDDGVLEDMDLVGFGRELLDRYQHSRAFDQVMGVPASLAFGDMSRTGLGSGEQEGSDRSSDRAGGEGQASDDDLDTQPNGT